MLEASIQTIDEQVQEDITTAEIDLINQITVSEENVTKQITEIESALQLQVEELMCARIETDFFTVNELDTHLTANETKTLYGPWCIQ